MMCVDGSRRRKRKRADAKCQVPKTKKDVELQGRKYSEGPEKKVQPPSHDTQKNIMRIMIG